MSIQIVLIITSILALILSTISCIIGILAFIKASSIEKSSHTVQLMPVEEAAKGWETSDKEIEKINAVNKDDIDDDFDRLSI